MGHIKYEWGDWSKNTFIYLHFNTRLVFFLSVYIFSNIVMILYFPIAHTFDMEKQNRCSRDTLDQGWAINFPQGPHEEIWLLWRAAPISWTQA